MMKSLVVISCIAVCSLAFAEAELELQSIKAVPEEGSREMVVTLRIVNRGLDNASHLGCNLYLYSYQELLSSQAFALKPLSADESREETIRINLTEEPVTRIKAEIFDSEQPDTQPSSNFIMVNLKPPDFRNADLEIVEASIETPQPVTEKAVVVRLRLRNNGPDMAPGSKIVLDLQVFGSPAGKVEKRVDRLAAGDSFELKIPIPLVKSIPGGEGTIRISWTGSDAQMFDPEPVNHSRDLSVQLTPRMPDLIPKDIKVDKKGILTFFIVNKGNAPSEASTAALFLNGALIQRYPVPLLQPGANFRIKEASANPESDTLVTVVADYNADVAELSEENNRVNAQW